MDQTPHRVSGSGKARRIALPGLNDDESKRYGRSYGDRLLEHDEEDLELGDFDQYFPPYQLPEVQLPETPAGVQEEEEEEKQVIHRRATRRATNAENEKPGATPPANSASARKRLISPNIFRVPRPKKQQEGGPLDEQAGGPLDEQAGEPLNDTPATKPRKPNRLTREFIRGANILLNRNTGTPSNVQTPSASVDTRATEETPNPEPLGRTPSATADTRATDATPYTQATDATAPLISPPGKRQTPKGPKPNPNPKLDTKLKAAQNVGVHRKQSRKEQIESIKSIVREGREVEETPNTQTTDATPATPATPATEATNVTDATPATQTPAAETPSSAPPNPGRPGTQASSRKGGSQTTEATDRRAQALGRDRKAQREANVNDARQTENNDPCKELRDENERLQERIRQLQDEVIMTRREKDEFNHIRQTVNDLQAENARLTRELNEPREGNNFVPPQGDPGDSKWIQDVMNLIGSNDRNAVHETIRDLVAHVDKAVRIIRESEGQGGNADRFQTFNDWVDLKLENWAKYGKPSFPLLKSVIRKVLGKKVKDHDVLKTANEYLASEAQTEANPAPQVAPKVEEQDSQPSSSNKRVAPTVELQLKAVKKLLGKNDDDDIPDRELQEADQVLCKVLDQIAIAIDKIQPENVGAPLMIKVATFVNEGLIRVLEKLLEIFGILQVIVKSTYEPGRTEDYPIRELIELGKRYVNEHIKQKPSKESKKRSANETAPIDGPSKVEVNAPSDPSIKDKSMEIAKMVHGGPQNSQGTPEEILDEIVGVIKSNKILGGDDFPNINGPERTIAKLLQLYNADMINAAAFYEDFQEFEKKLRAIHALFNDDDATVDIDQVLENIRQRVVQTRPSDGGGGHQTNDARDRYRDDLLYRIATELGLQPQPPSAQQAAEWYKERYGDNPNRYWNPSGEGLAGGYTIFTRPGVGSGTGVGFGTRDDILYREGTYDHLSEEVRPARPPYMLQQDTDEFPTQHTLTNYFNKAAYDMPKGNTALQSDGEYTLRGGTWLAPSMNLREVTVALYHMLRYLIEVRIGRVGDPEDIPGHPNNRTDEFSMADFIGNIHKKFYPEATGLGPEAPKVNRVGAENIFGLGELGKEIFLQAYGAEFRQHLDLYELNYRTYKEEKDSYKRETLALAMMRRLKSLVFRMFARSQMTNLNQIVESAFSGIPLSATPVPQRVQEQQTAAQDAEDNRKLREINKYYVPNMNLRTGLGTATRTNPRTGDVGMINAHDEDPLSDPPDMTKEEVESLGYKFRYQGSGFPIKGDLELTLQRYGRFDEFDYLCRRSQTGGTVYSLIVLIRDGFVHYQNQAYQLSVKLGKLTQDLAIQQAAASRVLENEFKDVMNEVRLAYHTSTDNLIKCFEAVNPGSNLRSLLSYQNKLYPSLGGGGPHHIEIDNPQAIHDVLMKGVDRSRVQLITCAENKGDPVKLIVKNGKRIQFAVICCPYHMNELERIDGINTVTRFYKDPYFYVILDKMDRDAKGKQVIPKSITV